MEPKEPYADSCFYRFLVGTVGQGWVGFCHATDACVHAVLPLGFRV